MAQAKLSKQSQRLARNILASAETISSLVKRVDDKRVRELVRRQAIPVQPDGYPASSMPERTSGGSEADPTFGTVLSNQKPRRDPVLDDLKRLYRDLEHAESRVRSAVARLDGLDAKVREKVERSESTPCLVCMVVAASKAGFCQADYQDWYRHGRPDRSAWVSWRRQEVNSEGKLLVIDCPLPIPDAPCTAGPHRTAYSPSSEASPLGIMPVTLPGQPPKIYS